MQYRSLITNKALHYNSEVIKKVQLVLTKSLSREYRKVNRVNIMTY